MSYATAEERYFLQLVNGDRGAAGRDRFYLERHLNTAADRHSNWMLETNIFSHTGVGGSRSSDRIRSAGFDMSGVWSTGENIAYISINTNGTLTDEIQALHRLLMNSPGHRSNLMSGTYDLIGIGLKLGTFVKDGQSYTVLMATQTFGSTDGVIEYDLAPGISIETAPDPVWITAAPIRAHWVQMFDGQVFRAGSGQTVQLGTERNDDFQMGGAAERLTGGGGHDWMAGGSGADTINGSDGNDFILGQWGRDTLSGENGNDRISGGADNDYLVGGNGNDVMRGDGGDDALLGQAGNDNLAGVDGNDVLRGDAGFDRLDGGTGNDRLFGGAAADWLLGGAGNDRLWGEGGADSFVFRGTIGRDQVLDYQPGVDRLMIDDRLVTGDLEDFVLTDIRKVNGGVVIDLAGSNEIFVAGANLTAQQVADGIFLF